MNRGRGGVEPFDQEDRISAEEACKILGGPNKPIARSTLDRWVKQKRIRPPRKPHAHLFVLKEVVKLTRLPQSTIYNLMGKGAFPKPIKISARRVAWRDTDLQRWI